MQSIKKVFLLFFIIFSCLSPYQADCEEVFVFHLEKMADNSLALKMGNTPSIEKKDDPSFSIVDFLKSTPTTGDYRMKLYDVTGSSIGEFYINASSSAFSFTLPYFSIANRYQLYDTKTETLFLDGKLDQFVSCNGNNLCEYEKNESSETCVSDCGSKAVYSEKTKEILKENPLKDTSNTLPETVFSQNIPSLENPPLAPSGFPPYFIILLIGIFLLVFSGTFFLLWKKLRKH